MLAVSTNADPDREEYLVHRLLARAVDALGDHVLPPRPRLPAAGDRARAADRSSSTGRRDGWPAPTVRVANSKGAHDATAHLIAHGHHRMAFLGDRPLLYTADERQRGYTGRCGRPDSPSTPICSGVARPIRCRRAPRCRRCSSCRPADGGVRRQQHDRRRRAGDAAKPQRAAEDRRGRVRRHGSGRRRRSAADGDRPGPRERSAGSPRRRSFGWLAGAVPTRDVVVPVRLIERGSGELAGPFATRSA